MKPAALAAGVLVSGAVLAAPAQAEPPRYGSNGIFGVNQSVSGWVTSFIPPGRYRVEQAHSMPPYQSAPGYWYRCSALPCAGNYPGHIIATGGTPPGGSEFMDILPSDTAVYLYNVDLTLAN